MEDHKAEHRSEAAMQRWRNLASYLKSHRKRFRHVHELKSQLSKFEEWRTTVSLEKMHRRCFRHKVVLKKGRNHLNRLTKENLRNACLDSMGARSFVDRVAHPLNAHDHNQPWDVKVSEFNRNPDKLASLVRSYDIKTLRSLRGVDGIAEAVDVSIDEGVNSGDLSIRQETYGINKPSECFLMFVWEALHDPTLVIFIVCAIISIGLGLVTESWPNGIHGGLGIVISILLVVIVTIVIDYKQSLQFKYNDNKKKIFSHVTRDGCRRKISVYEVVVGDVVHLSIGDQVPADGIFISGYNLLIDESNLTSKSTDPVYISEKTPFLLAGSKVQDGSAKMLVTAVGMKSKWGKVDANIK